MAVAVWLDGEQAPPAGDAIGQTDAGGVFRHSRRLRSEDPRTVLFHVRVADPALPAQRFTLRDAPVVRPIRFVETADGTTACTGLPCRFDLRGSVLEVVGLPPGAAVRALGVSASADATGRARVDLDPVALADTIGVGELFGPIPIEAFPDGFHAAIGRASVRPFHPLGGVTIELPGGEQVSGDVQIAAEPLRQALGVRLESRAPAPVSARAVLWPGDRGAGGIIGNAERVSDLGLVLLRVEPRRVQLRDHCGPYGRGDDTVWIQHDREELTVEILDRARGLVVAGAFVAPRTPCPRVVDPGEPFVIDRFDREEARAWLRLQIEGPPPEEEETAPAP
jgi:hypothetical protein